jgi:hypothetical protein
MNMSFGGEFDIRNAFLQLLGCRIKLSHIRNIVDRCILVATTLSKASSQSGFVNLCVLFQDSVVSIIDNVWLSTAFNFEPLCPICP